MLCLLKNTSEKTIKLRKDAILARINTVQLGSSSRVIGHKQAVVNTCDVSSKGKDEIYTKSIKGTCLINCKRREQDKYTEWSRKKVVFLGHKKLKTGIKQDKSDWEGLKTNSNKLVTVSTTNEKGSCTNKKGLNKSNESSLTCPTEIKFEKINGLYKDVVSNVILATDRAEWGAKVNGERGNSMVEGKER